MNRTFFIKSHEKTEYWRPQILVKSFKYPNGRMRHVKTWTCEAWESGQKFDEWRNSKITQRYQANIYAVYNLVLKLTQAEYQGEITCFLPDEVIVNEVNGWGGWYKSEVKLKGWKDWKEEELREAIQNKQITNEHQRGYYCALAYLNAKEAEINLNIKLKSQAVINKEIGRVRKASREDLKKYRKAEEADSKGVKVVNKIIKFIP